MITHNFFILHLPINFSRKKYGIVAKLSHGGFSLVWLVVDFESKDLKALKMFKYGLYLCKAEVEVSKGFGSGYYLIWLTFGRRVETEADSIAHVRE